MSLILFMETNEGLILTGDSRLSRENDESWHTDDTYKIFECIERIGIAYHNAADIRGEPIEKIITEFSGTMQKSYSVFEVATKLKEYIANKCPTRKTIFYVMGYDKEREIYQFNTEDNKLENKSESCHGCGGDDEIAWNMIRGNFDVHATVDSAIEFIKNIYKLSIENNNKIGGPIDILLISPITGTKWICRK